MRNESISLSTEKLSTEFFLLCEEVFSEGSPWTKNQFLESFESENRSIYIEFKQKKLIGFIILSTVLDEAEIELIVVSKEFKRSGVGSRILNKVINELLNQGICSLFLEVRKSNTGARDFYQNFLFEEIGKRKNYYKNPTEDGLILKLTL